MITIRTPGAKTEAKAPPQIITMTDAAAHKVKELIEREQSDLPIALRVAVRAGGCSGFSYEMYFDTEFAADDETVESGGVKVVVDAASKPHLQGSELDYADGLTKAGFSVSNPNVTHSCGCGNSFS